MGAAVLRHASGAVQGRAAALASRAALDRARALVVEKTRRVVLVATPFARRALVVQGAKRAIAARRAIADVGLHAAGGGATVVVVAACNFPNGCKFVPISGACDDGQACTTEACASGTCKATAKVCDDKDGCTADSCTAETGACVFAPIGGCKPCAGNGDCSDGNDCTTDACISGKCQNTMIVNCFGRPCAAARSRPAGSAARTGR